MTDRDVTYTSTAPTVGAEAAQRRHGMPGLGIRSVVRAPDQTFGVVEYRTDLVRGGRLRIATESRHSEAEVPQPGKGALAVDPEHHEPHDAAICPLRVRQSECDHDIAAREPTESATRHGFSPGRRDV